MTKKDYILISMVFRYAHTDGRNDEFTIARIIESLTLKLSNDNPLFNKEKFLIACGLNS